MESDFAVCLNKIQEAIESFYTQSGSVITKIEIEHHLVPKERRETGNIEKWNEVVIDMIKCYSDTISITRNNK